MLIPISNPPKNKQKTALLNIENIFCNRYKRPLFFHNLHTIFPRIADFNLKKQFAESCQKIKMGFSLYSMVRATIWRYSLSQGNKVLYTISSQSKTIYRLIFSSVDSDANFSRILWAWIEQKKRSIKSPIYLRICALARSHANLVLTEDFPTIIFRYRYKVEL